MTVGRRLALPAVLALVALAVGSVGPGTADASTLTIESPVGGSVINQSTPSFRGRTNPFLDVTLTIYGGTSVTNSVLQVLTSIQPQDNTWSVVPSVPLADGTYAAQATAAFGETSEPDVFTIHTASPGVSLDDVESPRRTAPTFTGRAGEAVGDSTTVTVAVYAGGSVSGNALLSASVIEHGGQWSYSPPGLPDGSYTVQAIQGDSLGNAAGVSAPQTFTINTAPPAASFLWLPASPYAGEAVSLASTSTDAVSPITGFAWDLAGNGAFAAGGPVTSTRFSAPGLYVVRMRVTDASGLSSIATATIRVGARPATVMLPFPIVRIVGSALASGAKLRLLAVEAPTGARITVACSGRGCPARSLARIVPPTKSGTAWVSFRRFERFLHAGIALRIRVFKDAEIGAYTSFVIRRRHPPLRVDTCLDPAGIKPIACPS
jgi:Bacterial Ig-like domain